MAKNLLTTYPGKVNPSTPQYPYGEPRDVVINGDGTGTPWQAELIKDIYGLLQALLTEANIVPSNTADNATNSQYLEGIKKIITEDGITTQDLTLNTISYPNNTSIDTTGFTTVGDGGGATWVQNGNTGQTPSQTPSQLNSALLNDANGVQWVLVGGVTIAAVGGDFLAGDIKYKVDTEGFSSSQTIDLTYAPAMYDNATWADLYNNGAVTVTPNFYSNFGDPSNKRCSGRVLIGEAASKFAGDGGTDGGTSWLSDQAVSPAYLAINSHLVVTNDVGNYAATFGVRSLNNTGAGAIAVGSAVVNDKAEGRGWGLITELQHEDGAWVTNGFEVAAKNKSSDNFTYSPYNATFGVFGGRLVAGGDDVFGGSSTNPSTAGLIIINNTNTWNTGIVIASDAITGTDGTAGSVTNGTAISMGRRHVIRWNSPEGTDTYGAGIVSTVTNTTNSNTQQFIDNGVNFVNSTGKQIVRFAGGASTVNYIQIGASTTGSPVTLTASGDDSDINLRLNPKGTGVVQFGTHTAIGAETVTGYINIKDSSGVDRKVAIVS
jgi:hypothetical protein